MKKKTRQRAPDERATTKTVLVTNADPPPLQSPTLHTPENNKLSHETTATQLSPFVQTTKHTRYTPKSSRPHPNVLKNIVKQPSLSVTQTSPQSYHIQHINKGPQRYQPTSLTHTPQRPRPTTHPTIGEDVTRRYNDTRSKRKPSSTPKELKAPKRTKSTTYISPSTTSPETYNPTQNSPLNSTLTLES